MRGRGDYSSSITEITDPVRRMEAKLDHIESTLTKPSKTNAAASVGRALGSFVGQGDLGALAGSSLARYFGHGDYRVKSNSLMAGVSSGAQFAKVGRGTRVAEREYIGDIVSGPLSGAATIFTNTTYELNPTNLATFPWLSRFASQYDQWEPHGVVFEFISTSSSYNGTSQALGTVVMATDYDPYDVAYPDKQSMENADYSCSTRPSENLVHGVECDPRERPLEVLYTATTNGAPINTTSLGKFQIATVGCSVAGVTLGELWISYDITFYKKQLTQAILTLPSLSASGSTSLGLGYFVAPTYFTPPVNITITQNVGVTSIVNLNNTSAGFCYMFRYVLLSGVNTGDSPQSDFAAVGGTFTNWKQVAVEPGALISTAVLRTTAPNCSFTSGLKRTGNSTWYFDIVQCPIAPFGGP